MALCPFAVHELLPENNEQNRINPTTVICHRAVSSAKDLYGYWNSPGVVLESHFYVAEDGTIYQYMDTNVRADANMDANAFAVSIETWDGGNTPDSWGWNPEQQYSLKKLILWICNTHGIKKSPAVTWNGGGIGGHNWFPDPWAGGPRGCPGTERNRQLREEIIPAVASGNIEVDDMQANEPVEWYDGTDATYLTTIKYIQSAIQDLYQKFNEPRLRSGGDAYDISGFDLLRYIDNNGIKLDQTEARLKALEAKVDALSTGTGYTLEQLAKAVADETYKRMQG